MSDSTHGVTPDKATPKRKAAGGCNTTTATTKNAIQIIALYARIKEATARFLPRFEGVVTADAVMMTTIFVLIVWGLL